MKEETVLELELDMEDRLSEFRIRKEEEVATQLERQLDKREEIMRNKALIEIRKREAMIRAEIEAQLGVKRAEIRDRLSSLTEQMDNFKEMAEKKMRDSIEGEVQGEIELDEERLKEQQTEFEDLQTQDSKVGKKQNWLQAIASQGIDSTQSQIGIDPTSLGALTDAGQAVAGRPQIGILGGKPQVPQPTMGLGGMRAPISSASSLASGVGIRTPRPVRSMVDSAQPVQAIQGAALPQPIPRIIRQPVQPVVEVQPESETVPETQSPIEKAIEETSVKAIDDELTLDTKIEEIKTATLRPVHTLEPAQTKTSITPVSAVLNPVVDAEAKEVKEIPELKSPATSITTLKPVTTLKPASNVTTTLNPVTTLKPASTVVTTLKPITKVMTPVSDTIEDEDEESEKE
jgi:hypothetical protein